jgi:hypothetical protein
MIQNSAVAHELPDSRQIAARIAVGLASAFVVILVLLHVLEPQFDPSVHLISEYETGQVGWLMRLAFFCWAGSALAVLVALRRSLRGLAGWLSRLGLVGIGLALIGAGIFITNASSDPTPHTANLIHGICGAFVIFFFPFVASFAAVSLSRSPEWVGTQRRLLWTTFLVWIGVLAFFVPNFLAHAANPGLSDLAVASGWPNRFMVVAYAAWIIVAALHLASVRSRATEGG